ncbi:hypothetical protein FWK35_00005980 [Aphis craccivora]|uniref:Uncharacterized protein n=1 Tax=Aphis craccivora TaxID=307492 RepID=A0A6G0YYM2_APHCR|nr:hypothetical protein FWK35_00005980 [Aphis craccivora]
MENFVLNYQLLATYANIFMNYTYKIICKNSIFELQILIKKNCTYVFL